MNKTLYRLAYRNIVKYKKHYIFVSLIIIFISVFYSTYSIVQTSYFQVSRLWNEQEYGSWYFYGQIAEPEKFDKVAYQYEDKNGFEYAYLFDQGKTENEWRVSYADQSFFELCQIRLVEGQFPQNEDEIMIDSNGKVEVVVYSDAPVIKLYLNGKEVGTATAVHTDTPTGGYQNYTAGTGCFDSSKASGSTSLYATFNVPFEEGKLEAKAFEADGKRPIAETEGRSYVETTGAGYRLEAEADREVITANGKDLSYVTIDVTDAEGRFVNGAEPQINVTVEGDGKLLALDNGVQNDTTSYGEPSRKAGKGKLLAIVQSTDEAGSFTVTATSSGYMSGSVTVTTEADDSEVSGERKVVSYEIAKNYYVKQGEQPVLPTEVKVNYSDDTSETKTVAWDEIPAGGDSYTVTGTIQDINLQVAVNVTMIGEVAPF